MTQLSRAGTDPKYIHFVHAHPMEEARAVDDYLLGLPLLMEGEEFFYETESDDDGGHAPVRPVRGSSWLAPNTLKRRFSSSDDTPPSPLPRL